MRGARRIVIAALATTLVAGACGGGGSSGDSLRYGLDFELNLSDTFDPQQSLSTCDRIVLEFIYGTLTTLDEENRPQPGLAESWEDNGDTFLIHLREGLEFSDGTPFDAQAVADGLNYIKTGEQTNEGLVEVESAEAVDETTVQLNLSGSGFALPYTLSQREGMIPHPDTYDTEDPESGTAAENPIGAGPFVFEEFQPGEHIVLTRNENYGGPGDWDGIPGIEFTQVGVGGPAVNALSGGEVDVITYESESQETIDSESHLGSNRRLGEVYAQLQLRLDEPFDDPLVRQAVNHAIDREEYIEVVHGGFGEVAWMPYPEASPNYDPDLAERYPHEPERARELLAQAGHPDGIEFDMAIPGGVTGQERQGELLQEQLAEAGITADIVPLGTDIATEYYLQRGADAFSAARPASPDPTGQIYAQWAEFQFVAIHNDAERPDITELIRQARAAPTDEERVELMQEAERIVVEEALEVPIAFVPRNVAWDTDRIEGELGAPAEICDPVHLEGVTLR